MGECEVGVAYLWKWESVFCVYFKHLHMNSMESFKTRQRDTAENSWSERWHCFERLQHIAAFLYGYRAMGHAEGGVVCRCTSWNVQDSFACDDSRLTCCFLCFFTFFFSPCSRKQRPCGLSYQVALYPFWSLDSEELLFLQEESRTLAEATKKVC